MPKLSKRTRDMFMNVSEISKSILFPKGKVFRAVDKQDTIFFRGVLDFEVPNEFAIAHMGDFLRQLNLFNEPKIAFKADHILIDEGAEEKGKKKSIGTNNSSKYYYCDKNAINYPDPDEDRLVMDSVDVSFRMTDEDFDHITRAARSLKLDVLEFEGKGGVVTANLRSSKKGNKHSFQRMIGESPLQTFKAVVYMSNFFVMPGTYLVEISKEGMIHFHSDMVEYWLAVEEGSSFGK